MDAFILGTLTSICGTVLFEATKAACNSYTCKTAISDDLYAAFEAEIQNAISEISYDEEKLRLKEFLIQPLVQDIMQQYCSYKISGLISSSTKINSNITPLTDENIVIHLYEKYCEFIKTDVHADEQKIFTKLFLALLSVAKTNVFQLLSVENQAVTFFIKDCVAKAVSNFHF